MTAGSDAVPFPARRTVSIVAALGLVIGIGCDDDPTAADPVCGDAPAVALGDVIEGSLDRSDRRFQGSRIEYYSLQLTDSVTVQIRLTSTDFDPFLYVFAGETDRTVLAQAFNPEGRPAGEEESAVLVHWLPAACHLLGASSWAGNELGAYRLTLAPAPTDPDTGP